MKKLTAILSVGIVLSGYMGVARAGCEKDNDCKGTRVCENGACVYPQTDEPAAPPPAEPSPPAVSPSPAPSPTEVAPSPADDSQAAPPVTPDAADATVTEEPIPPPDTSAQTPPVAPPPPPPSSASDPEVAPGPAPVIVQTPVAEGAPPPPPSSSSPSSSSPPAAAPSTAPAAAQPVEQIPPAPTPAPTGPTYFKRLYGEISGMITFASAGKMFLFSDDGDSDSLSASGPPGGGLRLSLFGARGKPHHGLYFSVRWSELEVDDIADKIRSISLGYTMKSVSAKDGRRVCPGFALDVGLIRTKNKDMAESSIAFENDTYTGLELFPRFQLDIIVLNAGSFKMVVPVSAGLVIVPFSLMKLIDEPAVISMFTIVQPAITVGISFGG